MKLIDLRYHLFDLMHLAEVDAGRLRHRSAFRRLCRAMRGQAKQRRSGRALLLILAALTVAMALGVRSALPRQILWPVLLSAALLGAGLCCVQNLRLSRRARRELSEALNRLTPRLRALPRGEAERCEKLLARPSDFTLESCLRFGAVCGCIRCGERFSARDVFAGGARFARCACPRCGAPSEYIVCPDGGAALTAEDLTCLKNLFDEEN